VPDQANRFLGRVPPHNADAEMSVIGGILLHNRCLDDVADIVGPADFYDEKNGTIYEAILELYNANRPIDTITLIERLKEKRELGNIGGPTRITDIQDAVPTAANIESHARVVAENALVRAALGVCIDGLNEGYSDVPEPVEWVADLSARLDEVTERNDEEKVLSLQDGLKETMKRMVTESSSKVDEFGVLTGFGDIDNKLGCLRRGDLYIIAGRPSMGKTALALNIAGNVASRGIPVHFFSLEMSADQLRRRMVAARAKVNAFRARNPWLLERDEWRRIRQAEDEIRGYPIFIDDSRRLDAVKIRARARRLKRKLAGLGLLIVDYLQIVRAIRRYKEMTREREVAEVATAMRALAQELDVPVLLLSQLNRNTETRKDKRPTLADLRESGEIEQIADVIMFLFRQAAYQLESESNSAEIILAKHRNGETGILDMVFLREFATFVQMAEEDKDEARKQRQAGPRRGKFKGFTAKPAEPPEPEQQDLARHPAEPPERDDDGDMPF